MALYEFLCTNKKCSHITEELRNINDDTEKIKCEKCNKLALKIMSGGSSFILKGDGWFKNGFN